MDKHNNQQRPTSGLRHHIERFPEITPPASECEQPRNLHKANVKQNGDTEKKMSTMAATNPGAVPVSDNYIPGDKHDKKDDADVVRIIDVSTPSQLRQSTASHDGSQETHKGEELQILPPTRPVSSLSFPGAVSMETRENNHASLGNLHNDITTLALSQSSPESAPMIVAAEIVDQGEHDRMATEIAELQARLRVQENQDVIQAVPMGDMEKDGPEHNSGDEKKKSNSSQGNWKQRRCMWILVAMLLIGGVVVISVTLSSSSSSGTPAPTEEPTLSPSTEPTTQQPSDHRPTQQPSVPPTSSQPPTDQPTIPPTLSSRNYLLQTLLPSTAFETIEDWEDDLLENAETPQAQAIAWFLEADEYAAQPSALQAQALQERYTLLVFYYATSGPNWYTLGSYFLNETTSVCEWNGGEDRLSGDSWSFYGQGIFCDYSGLVQEIKLAACELSGILPSELVLLQHLETLSLAENYLSGTMPTELAELSQLKYIRLDYNMLSGPLPPTLPATMKWLSFADNAINGTLPSIWGNTLSNLMAFDGWGNSLSGKLPTEWGNLVQFEHLDISSNWINGTIPASIGSLTLLQFLSLSANLISGSLPSEIGNLSDLTSLDVSSNHRLGGTIPSECGNLHYVKYFELGRNQFSGPIPTTLGTMYNLVELYLDGNQLSGSLPTEIGDLDFMLSYINIHDNPLLTGSVPSEYARMSNLQWFSMYNTSLTGSLDSFYCDGNGNPPMLSADCLGESPEMECSCCYYCCSSDGGCEWM